MGIFRSTENEKKLMKVSSGVGAAAGQAITGSLSLSDLHELADASADEIRRLYAAVTSETGERAARKATDEAQMIAQIWAKDGGPRSQVAAKRLTAQLLDAILAPSA